MMTIKELKTAIRNGAYTDIGGYPLYFVMYDGEAMSFDAVRDNFRHIIRAIKYDGFKDWIPVGVAINWEEELYCAQTNERIDSAYDNSDHGA